MYHVSLGVLEAGLYGIPLTFVCDIFLSGLPVLLTLAVGLAVWAAIWVWVMRRADARFSRSASRPAVGGAEMSDRLQATVLRYVAVAGGILLAFAVFPALLSLAGAPIGLWVMTGGFGFFCFVILLVTATTYALLGLAPNLRSSLYPAYPGFLATVLFSLAVFVFFVGSITGL